MKNVIITGSTRGIGLGLARALLKQGCAVVISGRNQEILAKITASLKAIFKKAHIAGFVCDVTDYTQVQKLWDQAKAELGTIDIWINNAGRANSTQDFWKLDSAEIKAVINTNLTGLMFCCQVVIKEMLKQGSGQIYNMEGAGSDGRVHRGLSVYGSTKSAVHYLNRALLLETNNTPVQVCAIRPGMVVTELLVGGLEKMEAKQQAAFKRIINILADPVEITAPVLAAKILKNKKPAPASTAFPCPLCSCVLCLPDSENGI